MPDVEVRLKLAGTGDLQRDAESAGQDLASGMQRGLGGAMRGVGGAMMGAGGAMFGAAMGVAGAGLGLAAQSIGTLNDPFITAQERVASVGPQMAGALAGAAADVAGVEQLGRAIAEAVASEVRAALRVPTLAAASARQQLEGFNAQLARAGITATDEELASAFDTMHAIATRESRAVAKAAHIASVRAGLNVEGVPGGMQDILQAAANNRGGSGYDAVLRRLQGDLGRMVAGE